MQAAPLPQAVYAGWQKDERTVSQNLHHITGSLEPTGRPQLTHAGDSQPLVGAGSQRHGGLLACGSPCCASSRAGTTAEPVCCQNETKAQVVAQFNRCDMGAHHLSCTHTWHQCVFMGLHSLCTPYLHRQGTRPDAAAPTVGEPIL